MVSRDTKKRMSRWLHAVNQRLLGIIFILFFAFFFLGPPFAPSAYWIMTMVVLGMLVLNGIRIASGLVITSVQVKRYVRTDWTAKCAEHDRAVVDAAAAAEVAAAKEASVDGDAETSAAADGASAVPVDSTAVVVAGEDDAAKTAPSLTYAQVRHLIVVPNYKEELETLIETLDTLANHKMARTHYKLILAMEEGEHESDKKAESLINHYQGRFYAMHYTVHPSGIAGEARGKSSNVAWATSYYAKTWLKSEEAGNEMITVMDADTHLSQKYFECISFKYLMASEELRTRLLFAPTLIFDRNANQVPFVVRLADMAWSTGLLGNFQMPVKFPCSVYTVTMLLAQRVGFWDAGPEAIGEDMHMALKCLTATQMRLKITPIYVPASCSNVQGDTAFQSIVARFEQSKRHLWGSLDFGYVNSRMITHGCWWHNPLRAFLCIYFLFEIFFQPYFGFYQLSGQLIYPASTANPLAVYSLVYGAYVRYSLLLPAVVIGVAYEFYHHEACTFRANILKEVAARKQAEVAAAKAEEGTSTCDASVLSDTMPEAYGESAVAFRKWYSIIDWLGLPFCLVFYYMIPGVNAMLGQLFTNKLDYKVSLKPTTRATTTAAAAEMAGDALELEETTRADVSECEESDVVVMIGDDDEPKTQALRTRGSTATTDDGATSGRESGVTTDDEEFAAVKNTTSGNAVISEGVPTVAVQTPSS